MIAVECLSIPQLSYRELPDDGFDWGAETCWSDWSVINYPELICAFLWFIFVFKLEFILVFMGKSRIYKSLCLINITVIWAFLQLQFLVFRHYMYLQSLSAPKIYYYIYCVLHYQFAAKCFDAIAVFRELAPMLLKRTAIIHFFITKPNRCTNFKNLFWHKTLHVSDSSSVHHQEFINCTLSNGVYHTGL